MQDKEKWFGRWDVRHLLHDASLDSSINEAFLQCQCVLTRDKCGGSRFTHYTIDVSPNYKTIFCAEQGNPTHQYMLESVPLSAMTKAICIGGIWIAAPLFLRSCCQPILYSSCSSLGSVSPNSAHWIISRSLCSCANWYEVNCKCLVNQSTSS